MTELEAEEEKAAAELAVVLSASGMTARHPVASP